MEDGRFKKGMIPWNKGLKGVQIAWNKGIKNSTGIGHSIPHSEETKQKCSESMRERWSDGKYDNRIIDYSIVAEKNIKKQEDKKMISVNCLVCNKSFYSYANRILKYCSKKCNGFGMRNENHWNWDGGRPTDRRRSGRVEYKNWRTSVFKRDNYTCQYCLEKGGYLHAHHIKEWSKYPELRYVKSNGLTLCKKCHLEVHRKKK